MNDFSIDTAREPTPQERDILQQSLLRPTDTSLNAPLLFDVSTMEPDRLACAVSTVLAHHTTLHSGIGQEEDGSPCYRAAPPTICTTDSIPFADDSIALSLIQAMADVPFDYVAARALVRARIWVSPTSAYLGLVFSHAVVDFTAMAQVLRDIGAVYDGHVPEPAPAGQSNSQETGGHEYYRNLLSGLASLDNGLLSDRRPNIPLNGDYHTWSPGHLWSETLDQTAFAARVAPVALVTYAVGAVTRLLTGRRDPVIAFSFANRIAGDTSVKNSVNNLPLSIPVNDGRVISDLASIHASLLSASSFQSYDLHGHIAEVAPSGYRGSTSPDVALTFYREELHFTTADVEYRRIPVTRRQVKFPLSISVSHGPEGYNFDFEVAHELQEAQPHKILKKVFTELLASGVNAEAARVLQLPRHLVASVEPRLSIGPSTILGLLNHAVDASFDKVAISHGEEEISYGTLANRVRACAESIVQQNMGRHIILMGSPSISYIVAFLGAMAAGRVAVPLAQSIPESRLNLIEEILENDCDVIDLPGTRLTRDGIKYVSMDESSESGLGILKESEIEPTGPAYIIFTSGTTGEPKGVVTTHHSASRLFPRLLPPPCRESGVWIQFHSNAFDFSVIEMLGSIATSSKLVVVPEDVRHDPQRVADLLAEQSVTLLTHTPTALRGLLSVPGVESALESVRDAFIGGEAMGEDLIRDWCDMAPREATLRNIYGPTETAMWVTQTAMAGKESPQPKEASTIGTPLADVKTLVCGEDGRPMPWGRRGEILIGGDCVSPGYIGRETLTRERFIVGEDGLRFYRTGDDGILHPDGTITYLGRRDGQVQVRGHRVEMVEIDSLVANHFPDLVSNTIAVCKENDIELHTFIVPDGKTSITEVMADIRKHLPNYMWPRNIRELHILPRTTNDKIDIVRLRVLVEDDMEDDEPPASLAPDAPIEDQVAHTWSAVLGQLVLDPDTHFFDLGGTSSQVPLLTQRLTEQFPSIRITTSTLFEYSTVNQMSAWIRRLLVSPNEDQESRPQEVFDRTRLCDRRTRIQRNPYER